METKESDMEDEEARSAAESSDDNDEGTQRYMKTMRKEGVQVKASLTCCCQPLFTKKHDKHDKKHQNKQTCDLRLCFKKKICVIDGKECAGEYCLFCL